MSSFVQAPRSSYSYVTSSAILHPTSFYDPYAHNLYPPFASQKQPIYVDQSFPPTSAPLPASSEAVAAAAAASTCVHLTQTIPSLPPLSRLLPHQESTHQPRTTQKSNSNNMIYAAPTYPPDRYVLQNDVVPGYHEYHRRGQDHRYHQHPTPVVPSNVYPPAQSSVPSSPRSIVETTHHHSHEQQKVFSFVCLPGITQRKRPRRKFHEIERLYQCNFPGCTKSYGTLNHLNAHVSMQQHGSKRHPSEFKELRKQWRKQKREQAAAAQEQLQTPVVVHDMPTVTTPGYRGPFY